MNVIKIAFIILSLCGSIKAQSTTPLEEQSIGLEAGENVTEDELVGEGVNVVSGRSATAPEAEESPEGVCFDVVLGARFAMRRRPSLRNLVTRNMFECCRACQEHGRCASWSRNREDGYCQLYAMETLSVFTESGFEVDVGGIVQLQRPMEDIEASEAQRSESVAGSADIIILEAEIVREAVVPDCTRIRGVSYPMGDVIVDGYTPSSKFCCKLCRSSSICNSWYFNRRKSSCVLNRDVPEVVQRSSSRFTGGTAMN